MELARYTKQVNKISGIVLKGLTLSALQGRYTGPRVLVNSIPKAGTNLLQELVNLLPLMRGRITRTLSLRNGPEALTKEILSIKKGQCAPAHISYNALVDKAIVDNGIRHVLIIRDFRDVILSNIQYLEKLHKGHPHNVVFKKLITMDQKIDVCLKGNREANMLAWSDLIKSYRGWLSSEQILVVRYENLVSRDSKVSEQEINNIAQYLGLGDQFDLADIRNKMFNPSGLTFNTPGIGKWKKGFSPEQISKLDEALGDELRYFGYEI